MRLDHRFDVVVIAGSAGGLRALLQIVSGLPPDSFPAVIVVQHLPFSTESRLVEVFRNRTAFEVKWAEDGDVLEPGTLYIAPPKSRVQVKTGHRLSVLPCDRDLLGTPAADPLLRSIASQFGPRAIAVILTGLLWDGAAGIQAMKRRAGTVLIQHPGTALAPGMPLAAIRTAGLHFVLPLNRISIALSALTAVPDVAKLLTNRSGRPLKYWLQCTDNYATTSASVSAILD